MRILIDALPLRHGGGTSHLREQLDALIRVDGGADSYHTLLSPWTQLSGLPGTSEVVPIKGGVAGRTVYEQLRLPLRSTDLLYCPANFGPFVSRVPMVVQIQSPNYYRTAFTQPETKDSRPKSKVLANHWAMQRADAVVSVSDWLAEEACSSVKGIEHKMFVVRSGAPTWPAQSTPVPGLPESYFLSVASAAPHKRVGDVVAGWSRSQDAGAVAAHLVLAGQHTPEQEAEYQQLAGVHADRLVILGRVNDRAQLKYLYENARAMLLMSIMETFSLTPVEASSAGCPLVLSDLPVHREVTSGRAEFIPVRDVARLTQVLVEGSEKWVPGSRRFEWGTSWDDNARALRDVFASVMDGRKRKAA